MGPTRAARRTERGSGRQARRPRLEPVAVHIRGDSGLGKSTLVLRFLDEVRGETPELAVLRGRGQALAMGTFSCAAVVSQLLQGPERLDLARVLDVLGALVAELRASLSAPSEKSP